MDWLVWVVCSSHYFSSVPPLFVAMNVDEAAVRQLVSQGLYASAEYWASLLVAEKHISKEQLLPRLSLYADVLFRNQKHVQAKVSNSCANLTSRKPTNACSIYWALQMTLPIGVRWSGKPACICVSASTSRVETRRIGRCCGGAS